MQGAGSVADAISRTDGGARRPRPACSARWTLPDVERAIEMHLDGGAVRLLDGDLVALLREVGRHRSGGPTAERLDRRGLGPGRVRPRHRNLGVLMRGRA